MGEGMKRAFAAAKKTRERSWVVTTTAGRQFQVSAMTLKDAKRQAVGQIKADEGIKHYEEI